MSYAQELEERVNRGIVLLSERYPQWINQIDILCLDMMNSRNCILGQLFGNYDNGCTKLGVLFTTECQYGFNMEHNDSIYLRSLWLEKITELRKLRDQSAAPNPVSYTHLTLPTNREV